MELGYGGKFWHQISNSFIQLIFHHMKPSVRILYVESLPALATDILAS